MNTNEPSLSGLLYRPLFCAGAILMSNTAVALFVNTQENTMIKQFTNRHLSMIRSVIPFACFFILLSPLCRAAVVFVDSSDDSGTYSLRNAITTSNGDNADTAITWRYTGGTISLGSSLPNINGATTLDVTNAYTAVTLYSSDDDYTLGLGGTVTIKNDATANPITIAVILNSTGSLTKDGDGTLYLTKVNTYSGGTILKKGIISISADSNLGAASGALTFDGGTLHIRDNIASARSVILNSGGGIIDTNTSYTLYLTGIISGAGGLTKISDGTLVLSGANTYNSGTTVSSGTIKLGANNALPTIGAVTVASGSNLVLGSYTQTIGSYSGGGNLSLLLQPGVTNLNVTGNAVLTNGTLILSISPQIINAGQTFTPITAGTITGVVSTIISPAAIIFTPTYSGTDVLLTAGLVPFADVAATANQRAVGAALEPLRIAPTGDIATVISNLYALSSGQLCSALDQISPITLSAMRDLAFNGSDIQSAALNHRIGALSGGTARGGLEVGKSSFSDWDKLEDEKPVTGPEKAKDISYRAGYSPFGFFASATGAQGRIKKETNSSGIQPGYDLNSGGLIMGADYSFGEWLTAGILGGYLYSDASIKSPSKGAVDNQSARYGVYASGKLGALRTGLYLGQAADSFTTERNISFAEISRKAKASPAGRETNFEGSAAYEFKTGTPYGIFAPFASVRYDSLTIDPFVEKGADSLNLTVSEQKARSMRSNIGLQYGDTIVADGLAARFSLSAAWRHEFKNQDLPIEARLSPGSIFTVKTGERGRDGLIFGVGLLFNWGTLTTAFLDYSGDIRSHYNNNIVSAGMRFKF